MELKSKGVVILRWASFIPLAAAAALLAWFLSAVLYKFSMNWIGIDTDGFMVRLAIQLTSNGAMGATFVYTGSRIAPAKRKVVVHILAVIAVLIAGLSAFPAIVQRNWWDVVGVIAMAAGAGLVIYLVAEGELDLDTHRLT